MSVSGLVITLSEEPSARDRALESLEAYPGIERGQLSDRWLPVVVERPDDESGEAVFREISLLPGVEYVDVVFVHFENADTKQGALGNGQTKGMHGSPQVTAASNR